MVHQRQLGRFTIEMILYCVEEPRISLDIFKVDIRDGTCVAPPTASLLFVVPASTTYSEHEQVSVFSSSPFLGQPIVIFANGDNSNVPHSRICCFVFEVGVPEPGKPGSSLVLPRSQRTTGTTTKKWMKQKRRA